MLNMVESNYEIYGTYINSRRSSNQRITIIMTLMVAFIVIGTATIKCIYYRKMVGFLKDKKLV
jgi:heme/copper-type cytochrome/quinol oxidase subunit 2